MAMPQGFTISRVGAWAGRNACAELCIGFPHNDFQNSHAQVYAVHDAGGVLVAACAVLKFSLLERNMDAFEFGIVRGYFRIEDQSAIHHLVWSPIASGYAGRGIQAALLESVVQTMRGVRLIGHISREPRFGDDITLPVLVNEGFARTISLSSRFYYPPPLDAEKVWVQFGEWPRAV